MDKKKSKGVAESRGDGVLSPEELETAIAEYRSRRASAKTDGDEPENSAEHEGTETQPSESRTIEEQVEAVKERQDNRDESDPAAVIAKQDEDMGILFDIIYYTTKMPKIQDCHFGSLSAIIIFHSNSASRGAHVGRGWGKPESGIGAEAA